MTCMDYKAVTKPDPSSDLTHWKYIKREKINGKWRYYYNDSELKTDDNKTTEPTVNNVNSLRISEKVVDQAQKYGKELAKDLQETSRKFDNVKYDKLDKKYKEDQDNATSLSAYAESSVKRGSNAAKKILNNIGNGTLDNRVDEMANKAKKKVNKLFRKAKKKLGIN